MSASWLTIWILSAAAIYGPSQRAGSPNPDKGPPDAAGLQAAPSPSTSDDELDRFIRELDDPDWAVRERATAAIPEFGPNAYDALQRAFQTADSYEHRRRIKRVAADIYFTEHLGPPKAFLGISHQARSRSSRPGPDQLAPWMSALYVTDVFPGSAAAAAGLRRADLILALNGETGTLDQPASSFVGWIGAQQPGSECRLQVLRGGEGIYFEEGRTPEFTPEAFAGAQVTARTHRDDARIPIGYGALLVRDVKKVPALVDLREGDLICSLNDLPIPANGGKAFFEKWTRGEIAMEVKQPQQIAPNRGPGKDPLPRSTAHVLRGGVGKDFVVRLGRWPSNVPAANRNPQPGSASPQQVREEFDAWWRERFDPEGSFAENAEELPGWRLDDGWKGR